MVTVYRYVDLYDNLTKYIGIVASNNLNRCLEDRLKEHRVKDCWAKGNYSVEYFNVRTRTDAEAFESHLIALYRTYNFYNKAKSNWGISDFLPTNINWKEYVTYDGDFVKDKNRRFSEYSKGYKEINECYYETKYKCWKGKNGFWYSYLPDPTRRYGRKLIRRKKKEELVSFINKFYSINSMVS